MIEESDGDFEFPEKVLRLTFEGTELAGLIIETSTVTMEGLLGIQEKSLQVEELRKGAQTDAAKNRIMMVEFRAMVDLFVDVIVDWNVKKNGQKVPPSAENLLKQPPEYLMSLIKIWVGVAGGVDEDLKEDSQIGNTSMEELIPMEVS
jgi:hypothetical protein